MIRNVWRSVAFAVVLASGSTAFAQGGATGSIAGVVRDTSGLVLPGVTVEASSPALIEKSRSVVTDDQGAYVIVELRPGTYTVTFTLSGFATLVHEGIELTSNFTAPLSVELKVGGLEETVTVTGQSPVVDTRNTVQQRVFQKAVMEALPLGQSLAAYTGLIPGAVNPYGTQDVGGNQGENQQGFRIHGSRGADFLQLRDGMNYQHQLRAGNVIGSSNAGAIQEIAVETSGYSAEAETSGGHLNIIPRDGGNVFSGSFKYDVGHRSFQGNNITPELQARNARTPADIRKQYEVGGGFGGPIVRDKLWYYGSLHYWVTSVYQAGSYYNKRQGTLFYEPDLSRPAYNLNYYGELGGRLTWQAAEKHKITGIYVSEPSCNAFWNIELGTLAPEATGDDCYEPNLRFQSTWTFPATSRLLLWAGATWVHAWGVRWQNGIRGNLPNEDDYSVLELSNNYRYGSAGSGTGITTSWGLPGTGRHDLMGQANGNFTMQYVTGTHAFKTGVSVRRTPREQFSRFNHDVSYTFRNGVPNAVTYWATPYAVKHAALNTSFFTQDQWTMKRLTLNLGLRYDSMVGSVPEQHLGAGPWVPARDFAAVDDVPNWKDINPRLGATYDLFGNGKTAVKAALGRYVNYETVGPVANNNPVNQMVVSADRLWTDSNGDYIPQENELGALSNANFGRVVQNTFYADEVLRGWGKRGYNWQGSIQLQQELAPGIALNVGYFRTWFGNFLVTDNVLVGPADYDEYCITVPTDARLPNSGQQMCGLYDIKPEKFGQVQNLVRPVSDFGKLKSIFNGVDVTLNARLPRGIIVSGGLATGSQMTDGCFAVDSPGFGFIPNADNSSLAAAQMSQCRIEPPWSAGTQIKWNAVVPLPYAFQAAVNWQSLAPIPTTASYVASNAAIRPTLGRDLGVCRGRPTCTGTATIELIEPQSYYTEPRNNQLDVRLTRNFRVRRFSVQPSISAYNVLNAGSVLVMQTRYGPTWQYVQGQGVLGPRMVKLSVQVNF